MTSPSITVPFSAASETSFMPFWASKRTRERVSTPSWSLVLTTTRSSSSSTLTRSSILALGSWLISLSLTIPVCLEPSIPTTHSVGETLMTLAFTILPAYRGFASDAASISSKLMSSRISSLIQLSTSSIIDEGVEAPAVTPTILAPLSQSLSSSSAVSTLIALVCRAATCNSFWVLEE